MRNQIINWAIVLLSAFSINAQSVVAPAATSYNQNIVNQSATGFSVTGFVPSATLLVTVGLVNPPAGTTLRFSTTSGVTASTGYTMTSNFTRISFTGTQATINTVLSSLQVNTGSTPGNLYIAVTATENPVGYFYLPSNGHFYRPISTGAFYTSAKAAAAATTFKGQTGYLVTITSADEDAFIYNNVPQSQIWFALSDAAQEGFWRIDAGPENGTLIKTANGQFTGNLAGQYNNWAGGEPNNSGGEHYAVTKWNGSQWNDLPNNFSCPYVIEYGTWTDPANQTFTQFYTGFVTHQIACSPATSPTAPTVTNGSRSLAGTVSLSSAAPSGSIVDWYANATGGNVLSGGSGTLSFTTPSISTTTTYYVQSRNLTTGCVSSSRTAVVATVNYPIPFACSGFVYGSEGAGIANIPVKLFRKLNLETNYTLHGTYTTTSNGQFNITTTLDISLYNFQIVIDNLTIANPTVTDAQFFNQKILSQGFSSKDYYRLNTNGNAILTIADIYEVYQKTYSIPWNNGVPTYRLFIQSEWNVINSSNNDLRTTYPGLQSLTIQSPTNNGTSNIYLIRTGYAN
jgi:hypothetical protein